MTTLNDISAADFLSLVETGEVDLADYLTPDSYEQEKLASSLSEMSDEELLELLGELEEDMDKEAGAFDLNELSVDEFINFAAHLEDEMYMDKEAGAFDLNELSVDEFLYFAADLEEEMQKEAMMAGAKTFAKKYIPGVAQFSRGGRQVKKVSRFRDKAAKKLNEGESLADKGTASTAFREKKGKDASMKDQIDSMMNEARRTQLIGGAKTVGTGAGVVGGMYGLKKMLN